MGEGTNDSVLVNGREVVQTGVVKTVGVAHKDVHFQTSNSRRIWTSLVAGACAGAIAKTVIAPLDRTKINFQISSGKRYSLQGAFRFLRRTARESGYRALWRGNTATIVRIAPSTAIQYASHEQWKLFLQRNANNSKALAPGKRFLAGSLAGVTAQSFTYPLDLARARMAVTAKNQFKNLFQVFCHIYRIEGLRTLYKGYFPTMLGVIPYGGVNFFVYETWKHNHQNLVAKFNMDILGRNEPSPLVRFFYGGTAGLCGQTVSYPLDIVRRRMQTAGVTQTTHIYTSIWATLRYVYINEGIVRGLYKGLSMNWIKGPISVGISFMTFDLLQAGLRTLMS